MGLCGLPGVCLGRQANDGFVKGAVDGGDSGMLRWWSEMLGEVLGMLDRKPRCGGFFLGVAGALLFALCSPRKEEKGEMAVRPGFLPSTWYWLCQSQPSGLEVAVRDVRGRAGK